MRASPLREEHISIKVSEPEIFAGRRCLLLARSHVSDVRVSYRFRINVDLLGRFMTQEFELIPDDQQEDEEDIKEHISFKEAVVVNADWTIETISLQINKGNIDLDPGFQRRGAWDDIRKSRLIESIAVGMPVPNIVLAEKKDRKGRFIVIDGKQRLLAISEFMDNNLKLKGLDIRKELNEKRFSDLGVDDREYLENATIRSTLIRNWSDENFLYALFYRLNSGSLPLSPQELRRALIGGNLLDAIDCYLSTSSQFQKIFGAKLDRRMRDSELVLRFIAFDSFLPDYKGDFKTFLDATTRGYEDNWTTRQQEVQDKFHRLDLALEIASNLFQDDAFKKWLGDRYERVINRALFDVVTRFFADTAVTSNVSGNEAKIVDGMKGLCMESAFKDAIEKTTKSKTATFNRINMWGEVLAHAIGKRYDKIAYRIV